MREDQNTALFVFSLVPLIEGVSYLRSGSKESPVTYASLNFGVHSGLTTLIQVPWAFADDPVKQLQEMGFETAAMALEKDSLSVDDPRLKAAPRLAIVLGTEGDGLAAETIAKCDYTVMIPMYHGVDSLNVAAASAVAFWELRSR